MQKVATDILALCVSQGKIAVLNLVAICSKLQSKTTQNVGLGSRISLRNLTLLCLVRCCPLKEKINPYSANVENRVSS